MSRDDWVRMRDQLHAFSEQKSEVLLHTPQFIKKSSVMSIVFSQMSVVLTLRNPELGKIRRDGENIRLQTLEICIYNKCKSF